MHYVDMMKRKLQQNDLISTVEAGEILGFSKDTMRRWAQAGKIPHVPFPSGHIKFYRADIEAMLIPTGGTQVLQEAHSKDSKNELIENQDVPLPGLVGF